MADLSPAAAAILRAFEDRHELTGPLEDDWVEQCLAAALRAAADQVVPEDDPKSFVPSAPRSFALQRRATRRQLLALSAELEGANG